MFLGISNFLEEISSLSHSVVFLYFFALITEEGFILSPCYSLELCIQMGISFLFSFVFSFFSFSVIFKASSCNHFAFLHFFLFWKIHNRSHWTILRCQTGTPSSGSSWGKLLPCLLQLLEAVFCFLVFFFFGLWLHHFCFHHHIDKQSLAGLGSAHCDSWLSNVILILSFPF